MKRLLTSFVALLFCTALSAQKIHFTDTSNKWKHVAPTWNDFKPANLFYSTYSYVKDSIIGSLNYKHFTFGVVREDTASGIVYIRDFDGDSDIVLLDYNLNLGDTFFSNYHKYPVVRKDSTLINSTWHKTWFFDPDLGGFWGSDTILVIEGIGCLQHPTFMMNDYSSCVECLYPYMYCFSNNSTTPPVVPSVNFFNNTTSCYKYAHLQVDELNRPPNNIFVYPNPTSEYLTVSSVYNISNMTIVDVMGRPVYTFDCNSKEKTIDIARLPSNIYFLKVNGVTVKQFVKN